MTESTPLRLTAATLLALLITASLITVGKRSKFQPTLLRHALAADAGFVMSVPREVVDARALLQAHASPTAALSLGQGLGDDPLLQQRMWEGLYPLRFHDGQIGKRLLKADDPALSACTHAERRGDVVLADCR